MDSLSHRKQVCWESVAERQFQLHLLANATCLLNRFVLCSIICLSGTFAELLIAAEPQNAPAVELLGDGRFLGYTRLREGTRVPATLGTVVALGPRRWAFIPAAAPAIEPAQSVTESTKSVEITVTQKGEL